MKNNIKCISLALMTLSLSAPVLAGSGSPFAVTVPNQQGGFTVGADLLYLRPSAPNNSYNAVIGSDTDPSALGLAFPVTINNLNPGYHWSFDLMAAYRIPCTGNDISLTWTHLGNINDSKSTTVPFDITDIPGTTLTAESNAKFKYDAVDLDLGQRVNIGDYFNLRLLAGVRYADLQQNVNNFYSIVNPIIDPPVGLALAIDQSSEFKGIGPQMGLEGRYCFGYGFGIDASSTLSAIVGRVDSDAQINVAGPLAGLAPPDSLTINIDQDRKTRVVPALDANLGVDYTFNLNNCSRSSIVVQAGYKVIHYWNVSHILFNNAGPNNATSISFDGPYVGIKANI